MEILPERARKPLLLLLVTLVIVQGYSILLEPVIADDVYRTVAVIALSIVTWIPAFWLLPLGPDADDDSI